MRRLQHGVPVAAAAGRTGQVDDEGAPDHARDPARKEAVRRLGDRIGAEGLRDPGSLALQHGARRLGRHVARCEPRAAGREHELGGRGELLDRRGDLVGLVGHDAPLDLVAVSAQELVEQVAARILRRAARDAVRHRQDGGLHSFLFSTSSTVNVISLSIAFAMS